jgi:PAS domain S-box-containing protein
MTQHRNAPDAAPLNATDSGALLGKAPESLVEMIQRLRAELAAERTEHQKTKQVFDLVQRALDVTPTEFAISNMDEPFSLLVYCNRARVENLGYTKEEAIGQPLTKFFARPNTEERHAALRRKLLNKETVRNETVALRKDGSTYHRGSTVIPLEDEQGEVTHFVSIGADITARMEAERRQRELQEQLVNEMRERERMAIELRLAQKLESVGRLAAGVAHEINTPIQYVGDSLYFLRSSFDDIHAMLMSFREAYAALKENNDVALLAQAVEAAVQKADLEFLLQEVPRAFERTFDGSNRVAGIVRAMKEFAHPDSVEHSPADINHALQTTLIVASNEYKYVAGVKTEFGELPPVICNIGELNQVFLNLIVNAAHAIHDTGKDPGNGGEIRIATVSVGDAVEITFADNGCGIAQEHLDKIYDPFFTTKEVGRGTGQGLAIARSIIVEKHGGEIRVDSTTGAGTQFILRLPINGKNSKAQEGRS